MPILLELELTADEERALKRKLGSDFGAKVTDRQMTDYLRMLIRQDLSIMVADSRQLDDHDR